MSAICISFLSLKTINITTRKDILGAGGASSLREVSRTTNASSLSKFQIALKRIHYFIREEERGIPKSKILKMVSEF